MHIFAHTDAHVHIHIGTYVHAHVYTHTCTSAHTHTQFSLCFFFAGAVGISGSASAQSGRHAPSLDRQSDECGTCEPVEGPSTLTLNKTNEKSFVNTVEPSACDCESARKYESSGTYVDFETFHSFNILYSLTSFKQ